MILPSSDGAALATALLSMACWGSWSNFLVFATGRKMRFELFYLNYSFAVLITAIIGAVTLGMVKMDSGGSNGERIFTDDFSAPFVKFVFVFLAGLVFNAANLALCKGIAMLGLALAFPLCIGTSMVLGTVLTYIISPGDSNAALLFLGVFVAFVAVCTAALMHSLKEKQQTAKLMEDLVSQEQQRQEQLENADGGVASSKKSTQGSAGGPSMLRKLLVCIIGGILMSLWNPLVTLAEKDDNGHGLTPFGEFVFYTLAVALSSLVLVPAVIVFPLEGGHGDSVAAVFSEYPKTNAICHVYSFLGGGVWAIGTLANAMAGASKDAEEKSLLTSAEAYAIGQCANVAAIFWGVIYFKEFQGTDFKVKALIALVLVLYIGAIALVTMAG